MTSSLDTCAAESEIRDSEENTLRARTVLLCFFGLVKNVSDDQLAAYRENVIAPLQRRGATVRAMLHTHSVTQFTNPRNKERNVPLRQQDSVARLHSLCPFIETAFDQVDDADDFAGDVSVYLQNGDPWPDNPRVSVRLYLRQLHSLHCLSQMLSKALHCAQIPADTVVIFLRPDVLFLKPLDTVSIEKLIDGSAEDSALLPECDRYGGQNDRFAVAPSVAVAARYAQRFRHLETFIKSGRRPHAEQFLEYALRCEQVQVAHFRVLFARVRANGAIVKRDGVR